MKKYDKLEHIKTTRSGNDEEKQRIVDKWTKSGILDGICSPDVKMTNMAILMESEAMQLIREDMKEEKYREIEGDLIEHAKTGMFDVITHGCNCFCKMGAGIAVAMRTEFGMNELSLEAPEQQGNINKLGQIESKIIQLGIGNFLTVINSYTQYAYDKKINRAIDYEALTLCLRKINKAFSGNRIGLPKIGAGLAGGDWNIIKKIIKTELKDCKVTVVIYNK